EEQMWSEAPESKIQKDDAIFKEQMREERIPEEGSFGEGP
ncbi:hypothetical protein A2U01_0118767, partial [Trifolium medium]|nr:hypothetical protein [Trifolium medium]